MTPNGTVQRMTREQLAVAIEALLHAADALGLADVAIKLNEALVVLGRAGVASPSSPDLVLGNDTPPTWH